MQKVYFFDTGFISFFNGWSELHATEAGVLWEHLVLNELLYTQNVRTIHHWRNKQKHEVDFILKRRGMDPVAIECKSKASAFDPIGISQFRKLHRGKVNLVVSRDVKEQYSRNFGDLKVTFVSLSDLNAAVTESDALQAHFRGT